MSPQIQNEFISLSARAVRSSVLADIKERRYFTILLDATPDSSHKEQISQIIRTVKVSTAGCSIEETFIDFIHLDKKKGADISNMIIQKLCSDGLDIKYCRGQGFDNGANMAGVYNGVQAHIRKISEFAEFLPCTAHSLNLVGQNAVSVVLPAKLLLGQIQSLYLFFSSSTERWNTLKPHVHKMLKSQSLTRWSSKADAVRAVYEEFEGILGALEELISSESVNSETLAAASAHLNQISSFRSLLGITIWNSILGRINITNIVIQRKDIDIAEAPKHIKGLLNWLTEFEHDGFAKCLEIAKEKSFALNIVEDYDFGYRVTRNRVPVRFRQNDEHEVPESNLQRFEREFFKCLTEKLIDEFKGRFTSLNETSENCSFLWGKSLSNQSTEDLEKAALDLALKYNQDLDARLLVDEIGKLESFVEPLLDEPKTVENTRAIDILDVITQYEVVNVFINCYTALRIFLTMPVTVAESERSFSKLKLIKNYLRSRMGQERLSDLAILSIEHERTSSLSFDTLIHEFASAKCRKVVI